MVSPENRQIEELDFSQNCNLCGREDKTYILITLTIKRLDKDWPANFACKKCSLERDFYCPKHDTPHQLFVGETTACFRCINEEVESSQQQIVELFDTGITQSPHRVNILADVGKWAEVVQEMIGRPRDKSIAAAVVTAAHRFRTTNEKIVQRVAKEGAGVILPILPYNAMWRDI